MNFSFVCRDKLLVPEVQKQQNETDVEMNNLTEEHVQLTNDSKNVDIVAAK